MSEDEKDQWDAPMKAVPLRDILGLKAASDAHGIPVADPRAFPRGGPPPVLGLPPGPWRVVWEDPNCATKVVDASGQVVMRVDSRGWRIDAPPEVLRAVEALPLLVEAARGLVANVAAMGREGDYLTSAVRDAAKVLRDVLARADGEGRADT
jgi:hypothetical protein